MADERKYTGRHHISIDRRERVVITGVVEVISFDDEAIVCETEMGALILRGHNLHVNRLNLDDGELEVDGEIENIGYEDDMSLGRGKNSLLSRIFK
ncbi:MAG: sporulation protein YabP [Defluviitaleaceae bacterium]|nr:sporulation protein YabP [Defluviitaleaceae bacterium]